MKRLLAMVAILAAVAFPVIAGEWHSGTNNLCTDCHTMHFSQTHNWDGSTPVPTTPAANGNWLGATGPNEFLLKLPGNQLCLACHDGQSFAPDVLGTNVNAAPTQGRSAGATNEAALGSPYDPFKGHTLDSTATPPGYNSGAFAAAAGAPANWYLATYTSGLECISCHAQHGPTTAYRNLGPYALGGAATASRPTYVINTTNDATKDVQIAVAPPYTPNSGSAATFNPYYDNANVSYNRNDATVGGKLTSNRMDTFCATCHGDFHGGAGDTNIGATPAALDGFIRHPTSQVVIGGAAAQSYGGHSALTRYTGATTKVKVYSSVSGFTDATPGCVSCHKGHGNQNPFGLVFLSRSATSVGEEGGYGATQTQDLKTGYRNLCGQCHGQGSDGTLN